MNLSNYTLEEIEDGCLENLAQSQSVLQDANNFCIELFRRALDGESNEAWTAMYRGLETWVTLQVRLFCYKFSVTNENPDFFVNISFFRYWRALRGQFNEKINDFEHSILFLRRVIRSVIVDHQRKHPIDKELVDNMFAHEPQEPIQELLEVIYQIIDDEKDRLHVHCRLVQRLKPRDIVELYPEHWSSNQLRVDWQ